MGIFAQATLCNLHLTQQSLTHVTQTAMPNVNQHSNETIPRKP